MPPHLIKLCLMSSVSTAYPCHFWHLNDREGGLESSLCRRVEICRHLWERFPSVLHQQLPMVSSFSPRGKITWAKQWKLLEASREEQNPRKKKKKVLSIFTFASLCSSKSGSELSKITLLQTLEWSFFSLLEGIWELTCISKISVWISFNSNYVNYGGIMK